MIKQGSHENKMAIPFNVLHVKHLNKTQFSLYSLTCDVRAIAKVPGFPMCAKKYYQGKKPASSKIAFCSSSCSYCSSCKWFITWYQSPDSRYYYSISSINELLVPINKVKAQRLTVCQLCILRTCLTWPPHFWCSFFAPQITWLCTVHETHIMCMYIMWYTYMYILLHVHHSYHNTYIHTTHHATCISCG